MSEVGGSGANGTAIISTDKTGAIEWRVDIPTGLAPGEHRTLIGIGSCATRPLDTPLTTPAPGEVSGASEASVERGNVQPGGPGLGPLQDGFHYIAVYDLVANSGAVVSCGDIPALTQDGTAPTDPIDFVRVNVKERDGTGVSGDLILWERSGGVGVEGEIATRERFLLSWHIHTGSCAVPESSQVLFDFRPLAVWQVEHRGVDYPVVAQADLAALQDGFHHIDAHFAPPREGYHTPVEGRVLACGDIPEA
jgi:hypothetical protein